MSGGWFGSLGKPVSIERRQACIEFLAKGGYDVTQAAMVVAVVAREMEHDEPNMAQRYMRTFVGKHEVVVLRALATLCS